MTFPSAQVSDAFMRRVRTVTPNFMRANKCGVNRDSGTGGSFQYEESLSFRLVLKKLEKQFLAGTSEFSMHLDSKRQFFWCWTIIVGTEETCPHTNITQRRISGLCERECI